MTCPVAALLAALLLTGCDRHDSKCEQAVRHVIFGMIPPDAEATLDIAAAAEPEIEPGALLDGQPGGAAPAGPAATPAGTEI